MQLGELMEGGLGARTAGHWGGPVPRGLDLGLGEVWGRKGSRGSLGSQDTLRMEVTYRQFSG